MRCATGLWSRCRGPAPGSAWIFDRCAPPQRWRAEGEGEIKKSSSMAVQAVSQVLVRCEYSHAQYSSAGIGKITATRPSSRKSNPMLMIRVRNGSSRVGCLRGLCNRTSTKLVVAAAAALASRSLPSALEEYSAWEVRWEATVNRMTNIPENSARLYREARFQGMPSKKRASAGPA